MNTKFIKAASARTLRPGTMQRVLLEGARILIANVDGHYFAVDDTCSHEDASLSTGSLRGEFVKCPLHGSRFSVRTGEAMEEPAQENLRTYTVRVEDDDILVGIG
ncbi:MAG: non-heme iron oxygenase ferredoxin subunit [Acidiferrobacterales bacterium]